MYSSGNKALNILVPRQDHLLPTELKICVPTSPFTILEPQNPGIDKFYVIQERRTTDFRAAKLGKGSSGSAAYLFFST